MTMRTLGQMRIWGVILLGLLAGCASMNEQECMKADWKLIGFEDGSKGKAQSTIGNYRKDCAKVSVVPDLARYQQGHAEGAKQYCVKSNGYNAGVSGGAYYGICPKNQEAEFLVAYRDGQQLYQLQKDARNLQSTIDSEQKDLDALQEKIKTREQDIVDKNSTAQQRRAALDDLAELRKQLSKSQTQIERDQRQLRQLQREVNDLQFHHQRLGY